MPCAACGRVGFSENAHVLGNGGLSRKADADTIAPLCGEIFVVTGPISEHTSDGCHRLFDEHRSDFDARFPDFNASTEASKCEQAWKAHQEERK